MLLNRFLCFSLLNKAVRREPKTDATVRGKSDIVRRKIRRIGTKEGERELFKQNKIIEGIMMRRE